MKRLWEILLTAILALAGFGRSAHAGPNLDRGIAQLRVAETAVVTDTCAPNDMMCINFRHVKSNQIIHTMNLNHLQEDDAEIKERLEHLENGRKAGAKLWEKRKAQLKAELESIVDRKLAQHRAASWSPLMLPTTPPVASRVPSEPQPTTSAPTAASGNTPSVPQQEVPSQESARIAELEEKMQQLQAERESLVAEVNSLKDKLAKAPQGQSGFTWPWKTLLLLNLVATLVITSIAVYEAAWVLALLKRFRKFMLVPAVWWRERPVHPRNYRWLFWRKKRVTDLPDGSLGLRHRSTDEAPEPARSDDPAAEISIRPEHRPVEPERLHPST